METCRLRWRLHHHWKSPPSLERAGHDPRCVHRRALVSAAYVIVWLHGGDELLRLTSHHTRRTVIEERPGRYLGYFVNEFGEQLVFVHDDGDAHATLFHGDVDWEPYRVTDAGGRPDAGDLILNDDEVRS